MGDRGRTAQRGLLIIMAVCLLGLPGPGATAQPTPPQPPTAGATTELVADATATTATAEGLDPAGLDDDATLPCGPVGEVDGPRSPEGALRVGSSASGQAALCRHDHVALAAFPAPDLPDRALVVAARLVLDVTADQPLTLAVATTDATVVDGTTTSTEEPPTPTSDPLVVDATDGTVQVDVLDLLTDRAAVPPLTLMVTADGPGLVADRTTAAAPRLVLDHVIDTTPPTLTVLSPGFAEIAFGDLLVQADATDDHGVASVSATIGGVPVGTTTTPPYELVIDTTVLPDGEQALAVEAVDLVGNTDRTVLPVRLDNSGGPLHKLDLDLEAGRIDLDTYVLQGLRVALDVRGTDARYSGELPEETTVWTWRALQSRPDLSPEAQEELERLLTPVDLGPVRTPPPAVPAAPSGDGARAGVMTTSGAECSRVRGFLNMGFDCAVDVDDVRVYWDSEDFPEPRGTLPAVVGEATRGFQDAQDHFDGRLGFRPIGFTEAYVASGGWQGRAISLPVAAGVILLNREDSSLAATAAHELFHQYQYEYLGAADLRSRDRASDIGWLLEATAEWASHQIVAANAGEYVDSDRTEYLRNIGLFLGDPSAELTKWTASTNRQYGAFVVAEWLHHEEGEGVIRHIWEEVDRTGQALPAIEAAVGAFEVKVARMWEDLYLLDLAIPGRVDADETAQWRGQLLNTIGQAPYQGVTQNRPVSVTTATLSEGDSQRVPLSLGGGGAHLVEVDLDVDRTVLVTLSERETRGRFATMRALPLETYDVDPAVGPQLCDSPALLSGRVVVEYDPDLCDGLSVIVANADLRDDAVGSLTVAVGERVDTTITNGLIRLGVNAEGHLNVSGFEASSGTGTTTVGLRYVPTNADALSPGCECEGWGIADVQRDLGGWANESYGGSQGLQVTSASFDADSGSSTVVADDAFRVTHAYRPSPLTPNLYEVDVTITNVLSSLSPFFGGYYGPLTPTYRRVMDWDVEPTAFSEFVTIDARGGSLPPQVIETTNDGFSWPDPRYAATDLGRRGLFEDHGPDDQGALFDVRLDAIDPGESVSFTMFYGAGGTSAQVQDAITAVDADVWSLAEPNVPDGPTVGAPNTFAFALAFPGSAAVATGSMTSSATADSPTTAPEADSRAAQPAARLDGIRRQ